MRMLKNSHERCLLPKPPQPTDTHQREHLRSREKQVNLEGSCSFSPFSVCIPSNQLGINEVQVILLPNNPLPANCWLLSVTQMSDFYSAQNAAVLKEMLCPQT